MQGNPMGAADHMPPMPWYPEEFLLLTAHWAHAERAALRALLDHQWIQGVLPLEHDRLARLVGISAQEFEQLWPIVGTKLVEAYGGLIEPRLDERRIKALRVKKSQARGARTAHANRRAQRDADHSAQHEVSTKSVNGGRASELIPCIDPPSSLLSSSLSSLTSEKKEVPRETKRAATSPEPWRSNPGLNVEAFESYLEHLDVLLKRGTIRSMLPPHSQFEQARWLSVQGSHSTQMEIVRRAIRHGVKMLQPERPSAGGAPKRSFDDMHASTEKPG
jgi:uncharacterized protein YdaU (DUF1376 family)